MKQTSSSVVISVSMVLLSAIAPGQGTSILAKSTVIAEQSEFKLVSGGQYGQLTQTGNVLKVETKTRVPESWGFQIGTTLNRAVKVGEVLLFEVELRALKGQPETGEGSITFDFTTTGPDYRKSLVHPVAAGKEWRKVYAPFQVAYERPAGGTLVNVWLGTRPQIVEIRNLKLRAFPAGTALKDLPRTKVSYAGMEPNASWRKAAAARIEKLRKGGLTVLVRDAKNRPIKGAKVQIVQTRHAFHFGTALNCDTLIKPGKDNDRYRATFLKYFNQAATENHLKWPFWEEWGRADGIKAVDWLNQHDIPVRAHNVIWPGWGNLPKDLPALKNDKAALRKRIDGRIADITSAMKGKAFEWDVVNETYANHDLMDILGWDVLPEWFRKVKRADPKPRLTLNDYPPLDGAATDNSHLNDFYKTIESLQKAKAPLEAIGFQCHIGSDVIPPARVLSGLDRFSKFGLPIVITELDIESQDQELQASYLRDFLTAAFSHPKVAGITQWGFWQGAHWMPNAALWDQNWNLRPHGKAYVDLVYGKWWSKASLATSASGTAKSRGFFGTYSVTVTLPNGKKLKSTTKLAPGKTNSVMIRA